MQIKNVLMSPTLGGGEEAGGGGGGVGGVLASVTSHTQETLEPGTNNLNKEESLSVSGNNDVFIQIENEYRDENNIMAEVELGLEAREPPREENMENELEVEVDFEQDEEQDPDQLQSVQVCGGGATRRRLIDLSIRLTNTIIWVVSQYLAVSIYCTVFVFAAIVNAKFRGYIKQMGDPLLLVSMACFVMSLMVEQFPLHHIEFFSNLFHGLFLTGVTLYFAVCPPFGMFTCTTLLAILTTTAIYATVFSLIKWSTSLAQPATGRRAENRQRYWEGNGLGCGLYLYGLMVVPMVLFVLSQALYFLYCGLQFDMNYGEYTANVITGLGMAMLICYERFRFLYYFLKTERDRYLKLEGLLVAIIKRMELQRQRQ